MLANTIGQMFKVARVSRETSMYKVERNTGVPHCYIDRLEKGQYNPKRVTFFSISQLAKYYGLKLDVVYETLMNEISDFELTDEKGETKWTL